MLVPYINDTSPTIATGSLKSIRLKSCTMAPHLQARQKRADAVTGMHAVEPLAGIVFSVIICLASITVISAFLTQRFIAIKVWKRLPFVVWLVFLIYIDSYLFVFVTGLLQFRWV